MKRYCNSLDSTRIKVTNRGEWLLLPTHKMECEKGYLKIHVVAVDIKKKKIVSFDVTSEEVHENGTMLKRHVDKSSENNDVKRVIADGAYDIKENFRDGSVSQPNRSCNQGKEKLQSINMLLPLKNNNNNSTAQPKNFERWTAKVKYDLDG